MTYSEKRLPRHIYTVSKLTQELKLLIEEKYPIIWISGEISNLRIPGSGHAYFTLKDEKAQIAAIMFKGQLRLLKFVLEDGTNIVGMGRISVYEPRGSYQMILEYIEPHGLGALQIAYEQLKRKLEQEGLFDQDRKKPLPYLPSKIGIITSPTGAAVRDILNIINRRFPNMAVDIYGVRVQGEQAADEIVEALSTAKARGDADVLILARGGGSLEDLAAYNSEEVARAISKSTIPVVSAVGHETDYTIADFVADLRAPTPSAAAELVVPVKAELQARCAELRWRCFKALTLRLAHCRENLAAIHRHMSHPRRKVQELQMRNDDLTMRLQRAIRQFMERRRNQYDREHHYLLVQNPMGYIANCEASITILEYKLLNSIGNALKLKTENLKTLQSALHALNPEAVLQRGYSITRTLPQGSVVTEAQKTEVGQALEITLAKGALKVIVQKRAARSDFQAVPEE